MLIDGKKIAEDIQEEIKLHLKNSKGRKPCLAVVLVGDHPASKIYIARKTKACAEVGIDSLKIVLPSETSQSQLLETIEKLNTDNVVDGILVQLPLPAQINPKVITEAISPSKDVDGFHPLNVGKMLIGETDGFFPCTPLGISILLDRCQIDVSGKNALILGRSNIVGKPMAAILMQNQKYGNATVTIAHSQTKNIKELCLQADLIITAMGNPLFLKKDMVKEGVIIVDVGINKLDDSSRKAGYRIVGDADFDNLQDKCSYITPVPGGVGPMTIAMLLSNTLKSYHQREKNT
jgi:methylenetetrahydrofolate dehydrogenase (NADP+)/methenyltetrahydrofolate cyclohydrolase